VYARVLENAMSGSAIKRSIFFWARRTGDAWASRTLAGLPIPAGLAIKRAIADRLVFAKLRARTGGRIRFFISGSAPLSAEIAKFFFSAGLPVLEGYGLTETSPVLTLNPLDRPRIGTVGITFPDVQLKIAADGEILAKGPNVMKGYYNKPEATAEAIDAEGWFHTGDIGEFDAEGFLRITDRKKDLIKTSGGKYVAPQKIENLLKLQPHVSQAVVIGDNRKYCVALITLDPDEMARWAAAHGLTFASGEEMATHPAVRELIEGEVAQANRELASFESVKYFRILPRDLSVETGELTPSLKVKRKVMAERYRREIEEMYA
jgi:long-chain acyl-CoA synthetase